MTQVYLYILIPSILAFLSLKTLKYLGARAPIYRAYYSEWGPYNPPPHQFYEDDYDEVYPVYQGGYNPNYQSNSYPVPQSSPCYRYFENNGHPNNDPYCFNQDEYSNYRKACSSAPKKADQFIQNPVDLLQKKIPSKSARAQYPSGFDKHVNGVENDGTSKLEAGRVTARGRGRSRGRGRGRGY